MAQPPAHIDAADQSNIATATETPSPLTAGGPKTLWYACGLMCLGIGVTAFSYNSAGPGQPYTILWGPVAVGVFLWGKAVFTSFTNARSVPWVSALVSIGVPIGLTLALTGYIAASEPPATQAANSEFEVFEQTADGKYVPRAGTKKPGVQELLVQFENAESARKKCDATDDLGYMRGEDAIAAVDGLMEHYAFEDTAVQHCIRLAVRKLDSEMKFAEDTAAGSR